MAKAGSFKRENQEADLMHDCGELNPESSSPRRQKRRLAIKSLLGRRHAERSFAECGRNAPAQSFVATLGHKKILVPIVSHMQHPYFDF
ncbi:hypothetical protein ABID08_003123 [Rhizobium binae]|uniref:Uncharacterized protein n=1 Tax=Rhizobium binae TaxID=1138190 RepID=A0ABV2MH13_9HYPH|nr:hypothetical protein [Rhizobium binae]MBX4949269.1 hypothetical protein [Rhizobium binae]MBX4995546.1 hypothetical protein [Rhizobium binae]NKL48840.1 hypothetical protein [Rhizobium leguminosarum bv. viciae]QSY85706.1 hypothetical protein J2J99_27200 [Rhizobium binae]